MSPLKVETGPMFSKKTDSLIDRIEDLEFAGDQSGVDFLVFNHRIDTRYGDNVIGSHNGRHHEAIGVATARQLLDHVTSEDEFGRDIRPEFYQLLHIFIDEAQFFDPELPTVLEYLDDLYLEFNGIGLDIHVAGLDTDFARRPFGPMPALMAKAIEVNKHTAICSVIPNGDGKHCKEPAVYTQRLIDGEPPKYDDPIVLVGAKDSYTVRCRHHHIVHNKPEPK